jgi:RyR domain-containing protein
VDDAAERAGRRRLLVLVRVVFGAIAFGGLVLGYLGLRAFVPAAGLSELHRTLNLVYYDLQLFVLSSNPLEQPGPYPVALEIARFAAPTTTAYALAEAGWAVFGDSWRRWRRRRARRHTIVVGATTEAKAIAASLHRRGNRVLATASGDGAALVAAGLRRARQLYICADDRADPPVNVATALTVTKLRRTGGLRVYAHVSDPDLAMALRARRLGLASGDDLPGGDLRLDFFNLEEVAARVLVGTEQELNPAGPPHIVVAGLAGFGRELVVEYARQWRLRSPQRANRLAVTLVDPAAGQVVKQLHARWPIVPAVCDLRAIESDLDSVVPAPVPYRIYICYPDEELALRTALTATRLWAGERKSLVVRLNRLARHGEAFNSNDHHLLDDLAGRLRLVGVTELACEGMEINEDLVERLAQAIHEHYLHDQLLRGVPMGSRPAMVLWSDLDEDKRQANRGQADGIGGHLADIQCTVAPRTADTPTFTYRTDEVERLAPREHERWCAERTRAGWRYGPRRNDAKKVIPSLRPWSELGDDDRDKDRDAIRNIPEVLAAAGLQVVRLQH